MNSEYEKQMGQTIRTLRIAQNLTQDQVATQLQLKGCDITRSAYAKIEVGQRHIYPDEIKALHEILAVDYESLFE